MKRPTASTETGWTKLYVAITSGGASIYVCGSQEPAAKDGQPAQNRPTTTTAQSAKANVSENAPTHPAVDAPPARLRAQQLVTRKAKAAMEIARLTRELAEIAVEEYEEVNYPRDLTSVDGEVKLAESDLKRFEDRLEWARRMHEKGYVSAAAKTSEEMSVTRGVSSLEQATSKRKILVDYTKNKMIKKLRSDVERARAEESAKEAGWEVEKNKQIELERQHRLNPRMKD
jgi:hypothetical protein